MKRVIYILQLNGVANLVANDIGLLRTKYTDIPRKSVSFTRPELEVTICIFNKILWSAIFFLHVSLLKNRNPAKVLDWSEKWYSMCVWPVGLCWTCCFHCCFYNNLYCSYQEKSTMGKKLPIMHLICFDVILYFASHWLQYFGQLASSPSFWFKWFYFLRAQTLPIFHWHDKVKAIFKDEMIKNIKNVD